MADRALDAASKRLVRLAELLQLAIVRWDRVGPPRGAFDPGERPLDPADGEEGAFIWHQSTNSTPTRRGKSGP